MIPVSQPSGLRELAASTVTEADKRLEVVQRAQISLLAGADKIKEPEEKTPKRQSSTLATRPKYYALEMWWEVETHVYLGVAGHMLAFYGKKTNPRASLPHDQAVVASKAIINTPTWMGYFARWRV